MPLPCRRDDRRLGGVLGMFYRLFDVRFGIPRFDCSRTSRMRVGKHAKALAVVKQLFTARFRKINK